MKDLIRCDIKVCMGRNLDVFSYEIWIFCLPFFSEKDFKQYNNFLLWKLSIENKKFKILS